MAHYVSQFFPYQECNIDAYFKFAIQGLPSCVTCLCFWLSFIFSTSDGVSRGRGGEETLGELKPSHLSDPWRRLLLLLAGDVEENPGPRGNYKIWRQIAAKICGNQASNKFHAVTCSACSHNIFTYIALTCIADRSMLLPNWTLLARHCTEWMDKQFHMRMLKNYILAYKVHTSWLKYDPWFDNGYITAQKVGQAFL